jgi:uncharacterized membrane protein YfcA
MRTGILLVSLMVLAVLGGAIFGAAYTNLFLVGIFQCCLMSACLKTVYGARKKELRPAILYACQPAFFAIGVSLGILGRSLVDLVG